MRIRVVPLTLTAVAAVALASCVSTPSRSMNDSANTITPCSFAPHCVSSVNSADSARRVEPFGYTGGREQAHAALIEILRTHEAARIEVDTLPVVRSTFHTAIGFVDDVTFVFRDDAKTIDVKSTSRIGYYDFGVNRRRVEGLRIEFEAAMAKGGSSSG